MGDNKVKKLIHDEIVRLLNNMNALFLDGELAFITLQQKNERVIRDKFAYHLQIYLNSLDKNSNDSKYVVRCEWRDTEESKRTDIAVLKINKEHSDYYYNNVIAVIEFKAHNILNNQKGYIKTIFHKDVDKMSILRRKNPKAKDADLYFILSLSSHDDNGSPKFKSATTYAPSPRIVEQKIPTDKTSLTLEEYRNQIEELTSLEDLNVPYKETTKTLYIGNSFGYTLHQTFVIWGPYEEEDIDKV